MTEDVFYGKTPSSATVPTYTGYSFGGYYTESNGSGTKVTDSNGFFLSNVSVLTDGNGKWINEGDAKTLYAKWTANTYKINYDKNGGSGSASSSQITKTYGTAANHATVGTMYKEGYSFNGWSTSQTYTGSPIAAGSAISDSALYTGSDVTLYANWKSESDVKVNFVNYSGISSNTYASTTVKYNAKATSPGIPTALADKTFTNFGGWYTAEGVSGNQIGTDRLTSETTYYARWYGTVVIDWQTGIQGEWSQWYLEDKSDSSFSKNVSFDGYSYAGMYTAIAGAGVQVGNAETNRKMVSGTSVIDQNYRWIATDVKTVYAKWTQSVTLDNQGTTNSSFTAIYNGVQASISPPTYGDKIFAGYYTEANGGGSQIFTSTGAVNKSVTNYTDSTGKWIKKGATTLYAKWEEIYTVTILKDSAAYGSKTLTLKQGGTTKATANSDSSGLAKFSGITNGNYDLYDGDTKLESSIAVSVGGSYTINYWTVSFNTGSGGSAVADQIVYNGKSATKSSADPTRSGYRFVSWVTESDGTTEYFVSEPPKTVTAKTTIYAKWVQVFTISFKTMDGTADLIPKNWSSSSKVVDIGASLDLPDAPASETDYFLGWAESSNAWKSSNLWLPAASTGYINIRDSLNVPDVAFLRYNSQGNTLTNITANKTLYAVYYKKLKGTGDADLDNPYKQEFIWNNALWRVIKADGNRRLILKVSALTDAETYYYDSGATDPDLPDKTVFNSDGNYFDDSGNSRYLGSEVKTKIERYYGRLSDKTAVQSVLLNLPTLATFTNNYFDTGNYEGTSGSTGTNWEWTNWYTDSRFATLVDDSGTPQAFALSYGDIQSLASDTSQKQGLLNFNGSNLNLYWLRSPGEIYLRTGIVKDNGNYEDSYTQNAGNMPDLRPGIRPALWVTINN
ncbi:MAG: InlB B-repeat-containing protein [Streptococcaceae bacterium]|nr:InlB B-repeat-containing protein [Streptococcaceae bacterium]MCH4177784.1 InlB B-repeat-containing protein [Streptococcaceae bacterium]